MYESLEQVAKDVSVCTLCPLHESRLKSVPGEGPANAKVMFIGEGPGHHENQQGRPFVGPAGQFLEDLLKLAGLTRSEVFIANVVKCRPPGNRDPEPEEIAACSQYLDAQIALIKPLVIVTLGRFSMAKFFPDEKIGRIHGLARKVGGVYCFAMYHPAAALHQPALKKTIEDDMRKLPQVIAKAEADTSARSEPSPPETAEQLSLF
jgi:uracil-DNA glycosylase